MGSEQSITTISIRLPLPTRITLHEIYYRQHGHRLLDPKQHKLALDPRQIIPTDLLQAKYEVVNFIDVTGTRAALIAWCSAGSRTTAGRLLYGPGGLGKTRLMISGGGFTRAGGRRFFRSCARAG